MRKRRQRLICEFVTRWEQAKPAEYCCQRATHTFHDGDRAVALCGLHVRGKEGHAVPITSEEGR